MTAAQPDPYETVRLLPADTFTQQTREEWIEVGCRAWFTAKYPDATWPEDCKNPEAGREMLAIIVDALLAYLAAQQARPMGGAHNG